MVKVMLEINNINTIKEIKAGDILYNKIVYGSNYPILILNTKQIFNNEYDFNGVWLSNDSFWLQKAVFRIAYNTKGWFKIC